MTKYGHEAPPLFERILYELKKAGIETTEETCNYTTPRKYWEETNIMRVGYIPLVYPDNDFWKVRDVLKRNKDIGKPNATALVNESVHSAALIYREQIERAVWTEKGYVLSRYPGEPKHHVVVITSHMAFAISLDNVSNALHGKKTIIPLKNRAEGGREVVLFNK